MTDQHNPSSQCRFCDAPLEQVFVDLGMSPLYQTHITPAQLNHMEPLYPLRTYVCNKCYLVQLDEFVTPDDIFSEYAYFSSFADSWVDHAKRYVDLVTAYADCTCGASVPGGVGSSARGGTNWLEPGVLSDSEYADVDYGGA